MESRKRKKPANKKSDSMMDMYNDYEYIHNSQQLSMIPLWIFVIVLWISIILSEIYI